MAIVGCVALAAASAAGVGVARGDAVVLADGHVDYAARLVAGQLRSQIKDGTQGAEPVVWRDPAGVQFELRAAAKTATADDPRYRFLGAAGSALWMIPQVQKAGVLWAGWNTEELTSADVDGPVTWTLESLQGPGAVAVFQTGPFGDPSVIFDSADGLPDRYAIPLGVHAHGNWAFSAPGRYQLTFRMDARRPSGEALADTQTLAVLVDPAAAGPGPASSRPSSSGPPSPGGPPSTGTADQPAPAGRAASPALRVAGARLHGRTLTFSARVGRAGRLGVTIERGRRVVARAKSRRVRQSAKPRTLRLRLSRAPAPGRTYRAIVRLRSGSASVARRATVRAPKARARAAGAMRGAAVRAPGPRARAAGAAKVTLADGHIDAGAARIVRGRLRSYVKDATGRQVIWRDPASVIVRVVDRAKVTLPAGMGFIGRKGQTVWMIPQVQKPGVIWAGWNTEEISSAQIRGGVAWTLRRVSGPGHVVLFQTGPFGQQDVLFDSGRRLPQRSTIPPGTHAHGNWAFTARGTYRMTFTMSATTRAGRHQTDTATLTYRVG